MNIRRNCPHCYNEIVLGLLNKKSIFNSFVCENCQTHLQAKLDKRGYQFILLATLIFLTLFAIQKILLPTFHWIFPILVFGQFTSVLIVLKKRVTFKKYEIIESDWRTDSKRLFSITSILISGGLIVLAVSTAKYLLALQLIFLVNLFLFISFKKFVK